MKKKLFSILPLIALGSCATKVDVDPLVETPEIQQQIEKVESTSSVIPDWFKELPEDEKMIYSSLQQINSIIIILSTLYFIYIVKYKGSNY